MTLITDDTTTYVPATSEQRRKLILDSLTTEWRLSEEFKQRYLSEYYVLKWQRSHLVAKMYTTDNTSWYIDRKGTSYQVHLYAPIPRDATTVMVSFRSTYSRDIPNIALIKGVR